LPKPEPVAIQDLLSGSLKVLERSISSRRLRIVRQIDPTTPSVSADQALLRKVLETLLAEAVAGTMEGGRIRICLKHSRAAVMVSIKEQGPGMEPGEWEKRLADARRPAAPGAPWPLTRCREAVSSLGGNLFSNSRLNKGSTYYVTFPSPQAP
jgi:signal transduction histidine kinase